MIQNLQNDMTPIGVRENGDTFYISSEDRPGIMFILGQTGNGKSVTVEDCIISDIYSGRGGMFIDPYGDLIKDVKTYIPTDKADKVTLFEAQSGTLEENIEKFEKEIDFEEMKRDPQKFLLCKLDYRVLGTDIASRLGMYLTKQFFNLVGGDGRSLVIDEAYNFLDQDIVNHLSSSKEKRLSCVLTDHSLMQYRRDWLNQLLEEANHMLIYNVNAETARIIHEVYPDMDVEELTSLEKYYFVAKTNVQEGSSSYERLKGVFPIPYAKN